MRPTVVSANVAVPPWEDGQMIGDVGSDVVPFPELGVAPLVDSGTDLEDELPMPDGSPSTDAVQPGEFAIPEVCPAHWGGINLELVKALLDAYCGPYNRIDRDSGFVPGASPSCTACRRAGPGVGIGERTGPCVSVFSPSGGGRKSGSG